MDLISGRKRLRDRGYPGELDDLFRRVYVIYLFRTVQELFASEERLTMGETTARAARSLFHVPVEDGIKAVFGGLLKNDHRF